jgi:phospholipid transport system substrate-binding protein
MQQLRLTPLIAILVLSLGLLTPAAGRAKDADAGAFLKSLSRDASMKLGSVELSAAQKEENFRQLFRSAFDVPAITRFVLGKYWRRASEAQRQDFIAAFEELHMRRFLPLFAKYDEEAIKVDSVLAEEAKPNLYRVSSRIYRSEGEPIAVVWRIRDAGDSHKVLDIVAEGVSMAISLRHEYGAVAKTHGLDSLLEQMRDKSSELAVE